ncbi:MAG: type IV secretory system conjugative DNA transfer family protein [Lachnospiraceae bacterium]|nr:type IV secretory system conjugative DNA transfer family protein [Lachnospiraceae bacterium]
MIKRRKTPYGLYIAALVFFMVLGYLISGLYTIPDLSIVNFQEYSLFICTHPFQHWWNAKSPMWLEVGFICWIMFIGWYSYNNRNFQFNAEEGTEDWGDPKKVSKELAGSNKDNMRILSEHVQVSKDADALSNNNLICVASSGRYKTTGLVEPNLMLKNASFVMLDVKGATLRKLGNYMKEDGDYVIRSLNFKEPWLSDRYNPFKYIERENDLIRLITNLQAAVKKPEAFAGDPFWDDGVALYLQAMFYDEWLKAREEQRFGSMNNILRLVNMENKKVVFQVPQGKKMVSIEKTELEIHMDELAELHGGDYPPVRDYRKLKEGAAETVRSIIIMVNAMLRLCETADVKRIFADDDINIPEIGLGVDGNPNKKVFLALVLPDNDTSYNFIINMFYTQLFDVLMRISDNQIHGPLPVPVEVWADEFYAGPKPLDSEALMGVIRSRNICLIPILQSIAQMQTIMKNEKWKIMFDNAAVFAFYGAAPAAKDTHEFISNLLGKMTVDTRTDGMTSGRNSNGSRNFGSKGRELMTPGEVKRMKRKDCILFIEGQYPIYDKKYLPWDQNKKLYRHIKQLGPYVHPVHVVYNEEKMEYRTIEKEDPLQILSPEDVDFYRQAAQTDPKIKVYDIDEKDFLYLNWHADPEPTEDDLAKMLKDLEAKEENEDVPEDVEAGKSENVPKFGTPHEKWNLSGNIYDCLKRYADQLSDQQIDEIITGMEQGLSDRQIKAYFHLSAEKMSQYRRAFVFENRVKGGKV